MIRGSATEPPNHNTAPPRFSLLCPVFMIHPPLHLLLVEDDDIDVEYFLRCLKSQRSTLVVTVARSATEALSILRGGQGHQSLPRPYVILLDLALPGINGFEFLHTLRSDASLKRSTVFVLSGSERSQDYEQAYDYHVAGYIYKAMMVDECTQLIRLLEAYREIVELSASP